VLKFCVTHAIDHIHDNLAVTPYIKEFSISMA